MLASNYTLNDRPSVGSKFTSFDSRLISLKLGPLSTVTGPFATKKRIADRSVLITFHLAPKKKMMPLA